MNCLNTGGNRVKEIFSIEKRKVLKIDLYRSEQGYEEGRLLESRKGFLRRL